jgi:hypothetical protein
MLTIRCCTPKPHEDTVKFRVPKRLQRVRRVFDRKNMDKIVKTAEEDEKLLKSLFNSQKLSYTFDIDEE